MPLLKVTANFEVEEARSVELMKELVEILSPVMDKPLINYSRIWERQTIVLGLTTDPALFIALHSIGKIEPDLNQQYSALICSFFEEKLSVAKERIFINFVNFKGANWGKGGDTLAHRD